MEKEKKNTKRSYWHVHLSSTLSMSLVLFLVGLVCLMLLVARDMSKTVKESINLSIVLDDDIGKQYERRIEKYLLSSPFTKSIHYISKEEALKEHVASLGENPQTFLGYNPLMASIEVKLNEDYANVDSITKVESKLKTFENINRVVFQKDMMTLVNENIKKLSYILLGLAAILLLVSIALIYNTIRLSLYSNRFLINTMRLVGATNWFIRKPYLGNSMLNGFVASIFAVLLLLGTVYVVQFEFGLTNVTIQPLVAIAVLMIVVVLGIVLTAISAFFAVGKYLKMTSNEMFLA
jgi:cell division transport system permease protein